MSTKKQRQNSVMERDATTLQAALSQAAIWCRNTLAADIHAVAARDKNVDLFRALRWQRDTLAIGLGAIAGGFANENMQPELDELFKRLGDLAERYKHSLENETVIMKRLKESVPKNAFTARANNLLTLLGMKKNHRWLRTHIREACTGIEGYIQEQSSLFTEMCTKHPDIIQKERTGPFAGVFAELSDKYQLPSSPLPSVSPPISAPMSSPGRPVNRPSHSRG